MEILLKGDNCIITPLTQCLYKHQTVRLSDAINEYMTYKIGINLANVTDCSIDFIDMVNCTKNLSLYNIQSDIFVIFNKMGLDKILNLYNSEIDFLSSNHRLLSRNLNIVK